MGTNRAPNATVVKRCGSQGSKGFDFFISPLSFSRVFPGVMMFNRLNLYRMETTTFKCIVCGWIGSNPSRFCVSSGHSCNPVRYLCPECAKFGKYSSLVLYRLVPRKEYYAISDPEYLLEGSHLAYMMNSPKGLENNIINHEKLRWSRKHSKRDRTSLWRVFRKEDVDAFIKEING